MNDLQWEVGQVDDNRPVTLAGEQIGAIGQASAQGGGDGTGDDGGEHVAG